MNKKIFSILVLICLFSLFLNVYKKSSNICLTADEAALGYNAYSIEQTGKDEYGTLFPSRLKSFGDYKMPLYSYFSVPFIGALGLNETSTRALNDLLALFFPAAVFFLAKKLFDSNHIALLSSFLVAASLGLHLLGRQAHESYLAAFLITLSAFWFIKALKRPTPFSISLLSLLSLFSLFAYQSSRIFILFFIVFGVIYLFVSKKRAQTQRNVRLIVLSLLTIFILFSITDVIYKPERVKNLLFFNNIGFSLKIDQLRAEGGSRLFYNKLTTGFKDFTSEYSKYFSPQFLMINGDENPRFGFPDMGIVTPVEYFFLFIGLYFLFRYKERWRFFLLALLLISPLSASLTWAGLSISRSLFFLIPILIIFSYGVIKFFELSKKNFITLLTIFIVLELFFFVYSWDLYLNHYSKRPTTIRAFQCGYKDLEDYVKKNYDRFDKFYITKKNGQPYIFLLFYLKYPPELYQQQASLSAPDQYGFGQVEHFDKFDFNFKYDPSLKKSVFIGYPDDFNNLKVNKEKIKKIVISGEEIFWIYENP